MTDEELAAFMQPTDVFDMSSLRAIKDAAKSEPVTIDRDKIAEVMNAADVDYSAREQRTDAGDSSMEPGDWFTFIAGAVVAHLAAQPVTGTVNTVEVDARLVRSQSYKVLAAERDFTGHMDEGRRTAYYEGFKAGQQFPEPVTVNGLNIEDWQKIAAAKDEFNAVAVAAIEELADAIRLTVEYVGNDTLPAIEGWSWFDALVKHRPELAEEFERNPVLLYAKTAPRQEGIPNA